jgi:hypothetical protein
MFDHTGMVLKDRPIDPMVEKMKIESVGLKIKMVWLRVKSNFL